MVPEIPSTSSPSTDAGGANISSSLRRRRSSEREDLLQGPSEVLPTQEPRQKLCDSCHYSCLRCHGPEDFSCTACAPDSLFTRIDDKEAYCYPPGVKGNMGADDEGATFFLARLNSNELLVVVIAFAGIVFIVFLGAYFFFRNVCGTERKNYTYNALDGDEEQRVQLTYDRNSAIAFRREIDSIINEDSSDISCSEDEEDVLERVLNR